MTWPEYLAGCCRIDGRLTRLTFGETDVLCALLLANPEQSIPTRELVERVWSNPDTEPRDPCNIISSVIYGLRRRGIVVLNRHTFGYCIPREARGRERLKLAA